MWERSQGHPADKVGCYQCHAGHAEPPASINVGAVVRDQLIPEKYTCSLPFRNYGTMDKLRDYVPVADLKLK